MIDFTLPWPLTTVKALLGSNLGLHNVLFPGLSLDVAGKEEERERQGGYSPVAIEVGAALASWIQPMSR